MTVQVIIYVQDSLVPKRDRSLALKPIELDWEPGLTDGPTSPRIAVVDYDADKGILIDPAGGTLEPGVLLDPRVNRLAPTMRRAPNSIKSMCGLLSRTY